MSFESLDTSFLIRGQRYTINAEIVGIFLIHSQPTASIFIDYIYENSRQMLKFITVECDENGLHNIFTIPSGTDLVSKYILCGN